MQDIIIDEETIQQESEAEYERKLTSDELEQIKGKIYEGLWLFIRESMCEIIESNNDFERDQDASKLFPHYKIYHRNVNFHKPNFEQMGIFKSEKDAHAHIKNQYQTGEWKIVRIDKKDVE